MPSVCAYVTQVCVGSVLKLAMDFSSQLKLLVLKLQQHFTQEIDSPCSSHFLSLLHSLHTFFLPV